MSTACSSRCRAIDAGFATSSHSCSCSRQTLRSHTSSARAKRCGDLLVGRRPHRAVREPVDVLALHAAERRAVEGHELRRCPGRTARGASRRSSASPAGGSAPGRGATNPVPAARTSAQSPASVIVASPRTPGGRDGGSLTVAPHRRKTAPPLRTATPRPPVRGADDGGSRSARRHGHAGDRADQCRRPPRRSPASTGPQTARPTAHADDTAVAMTVSTSPRSEGSSRACSRWRRSSRPRSGA